MKNREHKSENPKHKLPHNSALEALTIDVILFFSLVKIVHNKYEINSRNHLSGL